MHITALFTINLFLAITCVFCAPVHADYWLVTRTVIPVNPIRILASTRQNSNVPPYVPTRNAASSQARVGVSASNNAKHFEKLKLSAAQFPVNHKALPIDGGSTCLGPAIGKTSSTICHSGSENPGLPEYFDRLPGYEGHTGNDIYLHPDGKGGPDTNTVKKVTVGDNIGAGEFGSVHEVDHHELDHHGPLVVKHFFNSYSEHTDKEISNLRQVGQLHASGTYNGRTYVVMPKARGVHLTKTNGYFMALSGHEMLGAITNNARTKAGEAVLEAAKEHGLVHNDAHHGNVRYEEDDKGNLTKAHLVDWGDASPAPKGEGPNGEFTKEQANQIKFISMSQFIHGKRR